jgi:hypothetical protein
MKVRIEISYTDFRGNLQNGTLPRRVVGKMPCIDEVIELDRRLPEEDEEGNINHVKILDN